MKRLIPLVVMLGLFAGCSKGGDGSPTTPASPTPAATPDATRTIALEGDLDFGDVVVGRSSEKVIRILNRGTATMTVSSLSGPTGGAFTASWTEGAIQASQWRDVTVYFEPTAVQSYSGTMTVNGNQTGGTNTLAISARGLAAPGPGPTPPPPTSQTLTLSGIVRESGGGALGGADLEVLYSIDDRVYRTADSTGNYSISGLRGGSITVRASRTGYATHEQRITLSSNQRLDFSLQRNATPAPAPPPPSVCSGATGPFTWDNNVQRCRAANGQFAQSACCGR